MEQINKLYLIDGMSLVFRAYHAMASSGLKSHKGEPTGAIFAFSNIITALLEKYNPKHIAVVFDTSAPTFRHNIYPEYKANRAEFPEELAPQLIKIKELLDLIKIPRIELNGYEADDIIGTLAKNASKENWEVVCITSDKDYYQLVDGNISLMKPGKKGEDFEFVTTKEVIEKFGVMPNQVIDVLGLIGDSSDNVPGVKGIGEKTAIPLIQQFGSIENLYDNLDNIEKASVKSKFETAKEIAFLSKYLVTIDTNVPLEFSIYDCKPQKPDYSNLDIFFKDTGFNTIRAKWRNKASADNSNNEFISGEVNSKEILENKSNDDDVQQFTENNVNYRMITNISELKDILNDYQNNKIVSFDIETDSLDRNNCEIVGLSFSIKENEAIYIPVEYRNSISLETDNSLFSEKKQTGEMKWNDSLYLEDIYEILKQILENKNVNKIGQNIKFDSYIMLRHGINVSPITFDSMVASYIIDPDQKHNMDALSEKYLNYKPISISTIIGEKKSTQKSMREIPPQEISNYACEDADITLKLKNKLEKIITDNNLEKLAYDVEFPLIEVLTDMENNGIAIDSEQLKQLSLIIRNEMVRLKKLIFEESGVEFNVDSPKQLGEILFEKMMIPGQKKNKTGYSTDVQVLTDLSYTYPIAGYVLEYRQITKLLSTYVESLPKLVNPKSGRIHTTYNQTVASTGRLSSTDPNLQNIPIRTDLGKEIRKVFIPQFKDFLIFSADYSQIELRIMAYFANDDNLIKSFKNGLDIHTATAAILNGIELHEVTSDMRRIAKTVNFGIMYGLGSFGLSQRLGITRTIAKEIITNYFDKYPGIKTYMDKTINSTREKGYSETLLGRRRYFNDINNNNANLRTAAERGAINMPIQGTASDMMKVAMINIHNYIKNNNLKSKMLLQVHDELVFEVHKDELDDLKSNVTDLMVNALPLGEVPVLVETGTGNNWFDAH